MLNLEAGFIESKTGIKERRWSEEHETVEYMAAEASLQAVKNANVSSIDAIVVARDTIITKRAHSIALPVIESLRTRGIDTKNCFSIDVTNYCPGIIHALNIAHLMVRANQANNVLVVASTNYRDMIATDIEFNARMRNRFDANNKKIRHFSAPRGEFQPPRMNAFLWGCGAGALVIGTSAEKGIISYSAGASRRILRNSYGIGENDCGETFAALDGRAIYKYAVSEVPAFIEEFIKKQAVAPSEIGAFIPHQPNPRILRALAEKIPIPCERMLVSCDMLGNMIGASIPITYHLAKNKGDILSGDRVCMYSFGDSYLTAAALLFTER